MLDYLRRILIAVVMGVCVSLLFLGSKHIEAGHNEKNVSGLFLFGK